MEPKTSKDLPPSPPRKDERRDREKVAIADAEKTEQADWDRTHGDGGKLGLDET